MVKTVRNISRSFELQWILRLALVTALGGALLVVALSRFFGTSLSRDYGKAFATLKNLDALLTPIVGASVFFYAVVVALLAALIVHRLSHAVAAPLFRLEEVAARVREGDLSRRVGGRRGDQLLPLLHAADAVIEKHALQISALRPHLEAIEASWQAYDAAPAERREAAAEKALAEIEERLRLIEEALAR